MAKLSSEPARQRSAAEAECYRPGQALWHDADTPVVQRITGSRQRERIWDARAASRLGGRAVRRAAGHRQPE